MTANDITVGERSAFNFLAPYDGILSSKTIYEVTNITTIKRMVDTGLNPYENIYLLYGMIEADYIDDLNSNILIIELSLDSKSYYVPLDKFVSKESNTINYSERLIGIKLGFIPESEDISSVLSDINLLIQNRLGINANVGETVISSSIAITETKHTETVAARDAIRTQDGNYMTLYYQTVDELAEVINKLQALEEAELKSRFIE